MTILDRFAEDAPQVALHGEVHVVSRVVGFKKIKFHTNENVGSGELDLPEQQMHTTAYWLEVPLPIMNALPYAAGRSARRRGRAGVRDEAGRAAAADVRRARHRPVGQRRRRHRPGPPKSSSGEDTPRIFLYDAYPGGIGFSAPLWGMQPELLSKTSALIAGCDCDNGCPMCVGPIGETGPLAKTVALRMLQHLLAASLDDGSATAEAVALQTQEEEVPF